MVRPARVTIQQVADAAGVSTATVSRTLAGLPGAGSEVRDRVIRTADSLGYRVDPIARSLRGRRSGMVGLVVPDIVNPFFPALVRELEDALQGGGTGILMGDAQGSAEVERLRVQALVGRRVDALVISPVHARKSRRTLQEAALHTRVVQVDRRASAKLPYVGADHRGAMETVYELLRQRDCRRFAFLGYDDGVSTSAERLKAFEAVTKDIDPGAAGRTLHATQLAADEVSPEWLDAHIRDVDAVITTSDLLAVSLQLALTERGLRVPDDIAIVSFDNTRLAAVAGLTSIRQPLPEMAGLVTQLVDGPDDVRHHDELPCTLVRRASA